MAWDREQKARALEEVGALTTSGMQVKVAVELVSKRTGIPTRTLESWYWPNKRVKDDASPSKAALIALLKRAAEQRNIVTVEALDYHRTPVRPDIWIDWARYRGMNDMEVLGQLCLALYDEAVRLKGHCDRMDMMLRAQL